MSEIEIKVEKLKEYRECLLKHTLTGSKESGYLSMMYQWLDILPDDYSIVLLRKDNNIIGWGACCDNRLTDLEDDIKYIRSIKNKKTAIAGIFIDKEHRNKGYGYDIGRVLFSLSKDDGFKRLMLCFHSPSSNKLYKKLSKYIGVKRSPYFAPLFRKVFCEYKRWKMITL